MSRAGEVEVRIEPSTNNKHALVKLPQQDFSIKINEKAFDIPSLKVLANPSNPKLTSYHGPNIIGLTATNEDSAKIAKSDLSTVMTNCVFSVSNSQFPSNRLLL